jgi:hypothetical protein
VGSDGFVEKIKPLILSRRETEMVETGENMWALREADTAYGQKTGSESGVKTVY